MVIPNAAAVSDLFSLLKEIQAWLSGIASSIRALMKLLPRFVEVSRLLIFETYFFRFAFSFLDTSLVINLLSDTWPFYK